MPAIILPRRFASQPTGRVEIDWNNPLTQGLDGLIDGLTRRELVLGGNVTATGVLHKSSPLGLGTFNPTLSSTTNGVFAPASTIATGVATQAVFLGGFVDLGTQSYEYAAGNYNGTGTGIAAIHTNIGRRWGVYDAPGLIDSGEALTQGGNYLLAHTRDGSNHRLYNNGRLKATAAGSSASMSNAAYAMCTLGSAGIAWTCYTPIFWTARWRRVLSEGELRELARNPWQIFKAKPRILYFNAGTSSGTAVTVGQASETSTSQTITAAKAKTISQAQEASTAQPITQPGEVVIALGQVTETQFSQAVAAYKAKGLLQAGETDAATGLLITKNKAIGQASETGTALTVDVVAPQTFVLGQAVETETAWGFTRATETTLTEADLAAIAAAVWASPDAVAAHARLDEILARVTC